MGWNDKRTFRSKSRCCNCRPDNHFSKRTSCGLYYAIYAFGKSLIYFPLELNNDALLFYTN